MSRSPKHRHAQKDRGKRKSTPDNESMTSGDEHPSAELNLMSGNEGKVTCQENPRYLDRYLKLHSLNGVVDFDSACFQIWFSS